MPAFVGDKLSMSRSFAAASLLAVFLLTGVAVAPTRVASAATRTAEGSLGLRLLDAPVTGDPRARLYITDHLKPGTEIERRVEISNDSASTTEVALYSSAATIERDSFVGAVDRTPNDVSTWTTVSPRSVDIEAGGLSTATVTITVPNDAPPGEHYGVVWAEARSAPAHGGIVQVNRVGIRIYLSVGPGGSPAADFSIDSLTAQRSRDGRPMILATVRNTGGRALDMSGVLRLLDGPSGLSAGPFPAKLGTTLGVGDTGSVMIMLDEDLPAGPWNAQIRLKSGLVERTAQAHVTFPEKGSAPPTPTAGSSLLHLVVAAGAVLVAIGIAIRFMTRRRTSGSTPVTA
jgi:hypothetical protein